MPISNDRQWADYNIMQNSLPTNNQTNLALKGIIAIAAMSSISSLAGNDVDASQYNVGRNTGINSAFSF